MKTQEEFLSMIIDLIEKVEPTQFEHYLKDDYSFKYNRPFNPFSNNYYKGMNNLYLSLLNIFGINESNFYGTFKQISAAGGKIRKNAKAFNVLYYCFRYYDPLLKRTIQESDFQKLDDITQRRIVIFNNVRFFKVFSFDDIEDTAVLKVELPKIVVNVENAVISDNKVESFISGTGCQINYSKNTDYAYYNKSTNEITMPIKEAFKSTDDYYVTLFHELIHFTGPLLGRDMDMKSYVLEELIAEAGAMLLSFEFGTVSKILSSCAYFKGYLNKINSEKDLILDSFKEASKASNLLIKGKVEVIV